MSELMNTTGRNRNMRRHLLSSVSILVLLIGANPIAAAQARESEGPTIWIELGAQLEHIGGDTRFAPAFLSSVPDDFSHPSPYDLDRQPRYSFGGEGKISFHPDASSWSFSAAARFGRSNGKKDVRFVGGPIYTTNGHGVPRTLDPLAFADTKASHNESHAVLDFMAGRDVGFGLFGPNSKSTISLGVRFAQFQSRSTVAISMIPTVQITHRPPKYFPSQIYNIYKGKAETERSFHGVGPSISWEGTSPLVNGNDSELDLEWGANAAVLFGRQRADVQHATTNVLFDGPKYGNVPQYQYSEHPRRSKSIAVPNVGGFAALSFRYPEAKISFGYRGDIFFGAMDGGFAGRETRNRSFHGPFATISIGLP